MMTNTIDNVIDFLVESSDLSTILDTWRAQGITLFVIETSEAITVHSLIVPKGQRKQGTGSQVMEELVAYADEVGKRMELSPGLRDPYHGTTSQGRLVKFYKRFGFVRNKGRNKDFELSSTMYRPVRDI